MDPRQRNAISRESPGSVMVRDVVIARTVEGLDRGTALDLGCGIGANTLMLARLGWQATGIDISSEAIRQARGAAREAGLDARFLVADILTWEPDQQYDLVISTYSLPGGAESHRFMATAIAALKPGGTLIAVEWDHSMTERWGLEDDELPSPADIAAMVPGLIIESAESRVFSDLLRDDERESGIDATIAYLRARKPEKAPDDRG
ncbi:MAG TPA: class I SAM-dependent methyltransferase [Thermomicrobiales bacterium]|nr:class I SAM-dependent methyltransferase [Thermomicrobiales bacterium]